MFNTRRRALTCIFLAALCFAYVSPVFTQNECDFIGAPVVTNGSITADDPNQVGRLFRTVTNTTTCQLQRPATTSGTAALDFDQYTFTNTTGGPICVFVDLDALGCGVATNQISMAAYLNTYNPASILTNLIAEPGGSTGQNFATSMNFMVPTGGTYVIVVHNINVGTTCPSYTIRQNITTSCRKAGFDHNDDGSADLAIWRPMPSNSLWASYSIASGTGINATLGSTGDIPVPADYDGNETTEPAVFRGSNGTWYLSTSPVNNYGARQWGLVGDIPVQGDYDRDGLVDLAVFRPSTNNWYILRSATSTYHNFAFGATGDVPVIEDYDGDGRADPALFRPSNGLWTALQSGGNYGSYYIQMIWGVSTDKPVPADYDGDGKADVAIYRPSDGTWWIFRSSVSASQSQVVTFGLSTDNPQPADYDGDLRADQAIFRPSDATWWLLRSTAGVGVVQFGLPTDTPVTRPYRVP